MGRHQNLQLLTTAARMLRPILEDLVFVGGCTTALLVTDEAAADVRPTFDVDAVIEVKSYGEYATFSERLRKLDFREDQREGAPLCRWYSDAVTLDVMPNDERILGFSNRWYKEVIQTAYRLTLEEGLAVRVVTAPYFLGTKLEAFKGRGEGDFVMSQDLEDLISVIDGRPALLDEVASAQAELKTYVASEFRSLLANPDFVAALPGFLLPDPASQQRIKTLLDRLKQLAGPA